MLKHFTFLGLSFLGFLFAFPLQTESQISSIVISEIAAHEPSGHGWIEIVNMGTSTIDLDGWVFWENKTNHALSLVQSSSTTLEAGAYAIIAQNADTFMENYPSATSTIFDSAWSSLKESGEEIGLKDAEGNMVEQFTYIAAPDDSLQKIDLPLPDYSEENWKENASSSPGLKNTWPPIDDDAPTTTQSTSTISTTTTIDVVSPTTTEQTTSTPETTTTTIVLPPQTQTPTQIYSGIDIVISELLPNPAGSDSELEFIELHNKESEAIDLSGWKLGDGSTKRHTLDVTIEPNEYLALYRSETGIALNNSGEEDVKLYAPDGTMIDALTYIGPTPEGSSIARGADGVFTWTSDITPGSENNIEALSGEETDATYEEEETEPRIIIEAPTPQTATSPVSESIGHTPPAVLPYLPPQNYYDLQISEFLPNPVGPDDDEFIELLNPTNQSIDISGLFLDDEEGGSKPYQFPQSTVIDAESFLLVSREESSIALNNTGDSVRLILPDSGVIAHVVYDKAREGQSYVPDESRNWFWSKTPTPGEINVLDIDIVTSVDEEKSSKSPKTNITDALSVVELKNIKDEDLGDRIQTQGTVTALPGTFGSQYFYIGTSGAGIQIYMNSKQFPKLTLGDQVEVTGELSEASGALRLKVKEKKDIHVFGESRTIPPTPVPLSDIGTAYVGQLVQITGEVMQKKGSTVYIDDGTTEAKVYIKKGSGIDKKKIVVGNEYVMSGIVVASKDEFQLQPRSDADVTLVTPPSETVETITKEPPKEMPGTSQFQTVLTVVLSAFSGALAKERIAKTIGGIVMKIKK